MPRSPAMGTKPRPGRRRVLAALGMGGRRGPGGSGDEAGADRPAPLPPGRAGRRRREAALPRRGGAAAPQATRLVDRCVADSRKRAAAELERLAADLRAQGYGLAAGGLCGKEPRPLGSLAAILASHALIHAAEGEMFRDVLREALAGRRLESQDVPERDAESRCARTVALPAPALRDHLAALGRAAGTAVDEGPEGRCVDRLDVPGVGHAGLIDADLKQDLKRLGGQRGRRCEGGTHGSHARTRAGCPAPALSLLGSTAGAPAGAATSSRSEPGWQPSLPAPRRRWRLRLPPRSRSRGWPRVAQSSS